MKQSIQNKIATIKALSKKNNSGAIAKSPEAKSSDNLSAAIHNEKEAQTFKNELDTAIKLAKK